MSRRVLICGGRDYRDAETMDKTLRILHEQVPFSVIITGGASGADRLAELWARTNNIASEVYMADWARYPNTAGPIRNKRMLDEGKPDLVVAFPGGAGTDNMVTQAMKAGVSIIRVPRNKNFVPPPPPPPPSGNYGLSSVRKDPRENRPTPTTAVLDWGTRWIN